MATMLPVRENVSMAVFTWNWEKPGFDDSQWTKAQVISPGSPRDARDGPNRWMLEPRTIPLMTEEPERLIPRSSIRRRYSSASFSATGNLF